MFFILKNDIRFYGLSFFTFYIYLPSSDIIRRNRELEAEENANNISGEEDGEEKEALDIKRKLNTDNLCLSIPRSCSR